MLIFYLLLFGFALYKFKFAGKNYYAEECLSRDVTDSIKGIFIWLVFLSHFASYVTYTNTVDLLGYKISQILGQLIVACFFFYSGFGICEAYKKRGHSYIKAFPKNRILKTLLHFDIAVLLFLILKLILNQKITLKNTLLSFIGWESLGNSNWYIFVILALYLLTWISFSIIKNNISAALSVSILSVALIVFLYFTKSSYWYDTLLCYVLGMWISLFKDKILKLVTKNNIVWFLSAGTLFILFAVLYLIPYNSGLFFFNTFLLAPVFCLLITAFLIKFRISNKPLIFSGQYLFEIYILQRIPMIVFKNLGLADFNLYLYFISCLAVTILLAITFRFLLNKLDNIIFKVR
ncbi:MAG: acyltransferase family protein [Clostridia bacterium]|nr:acyltransferase family protein [Clostridia bacterium]